MTKLVVSKDLNNQLLHRGIYVLLNHLVNIQTNNNTDDDHLLTFLVDHKTVLLISMAGQHQIWAYAFEETQWWNDVYVEDDEQKRIFQKKFSTHLESYRKILV